MLLRNALDKKGKLIMFQQEHYKALVENCVTQDDWDTLIDSGFFPAVLASYASITNDIVVVRFAPLPHGYLA